MSDYSDQAKQYVARRRSEEDRYLTWMDVASAYDQGARDALRNQREAISNTRRRYPRCAVCGFRESSVIHERQMIGKKAPSGQPYHEFALPKAGEK